MFRYAPTLPQGGTAQSRVPLVAIVQSRGRQRPRVLVDLPSGQRGESSTQSSSAAEDNTASHGPRATQPATSPSQGPSEMRHAINAQCAVRRQAYLLIRRHQLRLRGGVAAVLRARFTLLTTLAVQLCRSALIARHTGAFGRVGRRRWVVVVGGGWWVVGGGWWRWCCNGAGRGGAARQLLRQLLRQAKPYMFPRGDRDGGGSGGLVDFTEGVREAEGAHLVGQRWSMTGRRGVVVRSISTRCGTARTTCCSCA